MFNKSNRTIGAVILLLFSVSLFPAMPFMKGSAYQPSQFQESLATIPVSLPTQNATVGTNVVVPITVGDLTGNGVIAYDLEVTFDPSVIRPQGTGVSSAGTLSSSMVVTPNPYNQGRLIVSSFTTMPLSGSGTLLNLTFTVVGGAGSSTALTWQRLDLNEGNPANTHTNGSVTVTNGQQQPSISMNSLSQNEGNTGTTVYSFTATLSAASSQPVSFSYSTADGTATASGDYTSVPSTVLTFNPGELTKSVYVFVKGDYTNEQDETFVINLSNPTNATLANNQATGTIMNDDTTVVVIPVSLPTQTGNAGSSVVIPVTTGSVTGRNVIAYDLDITFDPSVLQPDAITPVSASGTLSSSMSVVANPNMAGRLKVVAYTTTPLSGAGTLLNLNFKVVGNAGTSSALTWQSFFYNEEDPPSTVSNGSFTVSAQPPAVSINNVSQMEGNTGTTTFNFTATLSAASTQPVSVNYSMANTTATAPTDYQSGVGTLTFNPGETSKQVTVSVVGDAVVESNETFTVNLVNPMNATIAAGQGVGTIVNDDVAATIIPVSLPKLSGSTGTLVSIPVTTGSLTGRNVIAYDMEISFDPNVLQLQASPITSAGTVSSSMSIFANANITGKLKLSAFTTMPLSGSGTLLYLNFKVIGTTGSFTALNWQTFYYNEGNPSSTVTNGSYTVSGRSVRTIMP